MRLVDLIVNLLLLKRYKSPIATRKTCGRYEVHLYNKETMLGVNEKWFDIWDNYECCYLSASRGFEPIKLTSFSMEEAAPIREKVYGLANYLNSELDHYNIELSSFLIND